MGVLFLRAGNATRLCDANGRWTGSEPKCQPIACGDPVTFPHTTVALINGSTSWKARAQYSCIFGYQPLNAGKLKRILMLSHCLEFTRENIQTPCFWILHAGMHWLFICILNTCVKRNRVKNSRSAEQKCNAISVTVNVNSVTNHTPTKKSTIPFIVTHLSSQANWRGWKVAWICDKGCALYLQGIPVIRLLRRR